MTAQIVLYVFIAIAALTALGMLAVKNVFHAALLLMACLLCIAAIYVLLNAEFLAVTQILIYVGGVLTLMIFGIMLSSRLAGTPLKVESTRTIVGSVTGVGLFVLLAIGVIKTKWPPEQTNHQIVKAQDIGVRMMTDFVLPFEAAGVLLLMCLVGAAITSHLLLKK